MSDYTSTFTEGTGDTIDASDFSTEFNSIETAVATKVNVGDDITGNAAGVIETGASTVLNMKVIEIGDWNLNSSLLLSNTVTHGLTLSKIRCFQVFLRPDSGNTIFPIDYGFGDGHASIDATYVQLACNGGGYWTTNKTFFQTTSYNRGWIMIWYTD